MENLPIQTNDQYPILEHEPTEVMKEVVKVANVLREVVLKAGLAKKFGGAKEHLYYEAWQTVGGFFSHSVKTFEATPVEVEGVKGARARAVLYDREGREIGGAEAYCLRDEKNWKEKPFFQLASMAQTRAGSKAFRNKFAWVAVIGGYAGTPAEEMDGKEESPEEEKLSQKEGKDLLPEQSALYLVNVKKHLDTCKNLFNLKNSYTKNFHEWESNLLPEDMILVAKHKDELKKKFEEGK